MGENEASGLHTASPLAALNRLAELDVRSESWESELSAITLDFVDALLHADVDALEAAADPLRDALADLFEGEGRAREIRGWLLALLTITRWGVQRLPSSAEHELVRNTHAWSFLTELSKAEPRGSADLRTRMGTSASQVSRVGRDLLARGLVVQRRAGREALWELTPRGRQLLRAAGRSGSRRRGAQTDVRHVLPDDGGHGWRIAKRPDGPTIERALSKEAAVERATEIVERSGGGRVKVHDRSGGLREIDVRR